MRIVAASLAIALASCGPSLGRYEVADVDLVEGLPTAITSKRQTEAFLRIRLQSNFDLVADTNGNIYAFIVHCGYLRDEDAMILGPVVDADPPIDLYDAEPAMPRDAKGGANYQLFVPVITTSRNGRPLNLRQREGDLCIAIKQRGYFLTESSSQTIRIPSAQIARVLG
jgi:hypothetical protein